MAKSLALNILAVSGMVLGDGTIINPLSRDCPALCFTAWTLSGLSWAAACLYYFFLLLFKTLEWVCAWGGSSLGS